MVGTPSVAVLVPRRADGGRRDDLWKFCRPWWDEFGWPIIEGEHLDGPFNRGAAINAAAAKAGPVDVFLIVDGDVVIDPDQVRRAVRVAHDTQKLTQAYTRYCALNRAMTDRILTDSYSGSWESGVELRMTKHVSSVLAVPYDLFQQVRGFDPRFEGWGWDDIAFWSACRSVAGGVKQIDGTVWHLWHPPAPENTKGGDGYRSTPAYCAGQALADRYNDPDQVGRLVTEDRGDDQVVALVLTTGDRDTLADTIESLDANVKGPIDRRLIVVDGTARPDFDGWEVCNIRAKGFTRAVAAAQRIAIGSGQPWIFWSEDDFTFDRPVDLEAMQDTMTSDPAIVQTSLMRQAWFPAEVAAGGVIEVNPSAFRQCGPVTVHREYWTTNPHLTRRMFLAANPWPKCRWSEAAYGRHVFSDPDAVAAIWGDGAPWVTHIGTERTGRGY